MPVLTSNANATYAQMRQVAQIVPKELYFSGTSMVPADQIADRATKRAVDLYDTTLAAMGVRPEVQATTMIPR